MNPKIRCMGSRFLGRTGAVCAAWAVLAAPAMGQDWADQENTDVNVTDYGTVDLAVQETDLSQVLQMLSIQSHKNIITSKSVSATVTANLYDVTFHEALDAILRVNGYGYLEEGNFVYIYTLAELAEMEALSRVTESRIFELDYLSAVDANEFITPLLSDVGQSSHRGEVQPGFQPDISDGGADSYAYSAKLVINDYPENLEAIADLLDDLDTPPQQVLIEATVLQTALDETNAFGVDFSVIADLNFIDLHTPLGVVNNLLAGDDVKSGFQPADNEALGGASTVGNTAGAGGLKLGIITNNVSAFLRVLDEVTDTTVLARPKIMALNRQRAAVLVGARVGYLSTTATQTTTTQTVKFLDTGISLIFRPFISKDGTIRMELSPKVSEASLRAVTDSQGLQVTIPDELTNELTTNVRIRDGQTLVLGGLFRESTRVSRRQVPWLGDIPIIGAAFRGQDDTVDRDEIIFLITPTIVPDDVLWATGQETLAYSNAIAVGARAGLLPFSREGITNNHNLDAMDAYERGDLDMALYHVNISLRLNHVQPAMLRLRQEITGEKERVHERSMMERAFRKVLGRGPSQEAASGQTPPGPRSMPMRSFTLQELMVDEPGRWSDMREPGTGDSSTGTESVSQESSGEWFEWHGDGDADDAEAGSGIDSAGASPQTSGEQPGHEEQGEAEGPHSNAATMRNDQWLVAEQLRRMFSRQGLWLAADNPSGAYDLGWGHSTSFVTFGDLV